MCVHERLVASASIGHSPPGHETVYSPLSASDIAQVYGTPMSPYIWSWYAA
ncbi:hypothetical protein GZL_00224 [Streptomyces sp. 769]|nr:hypothetical protein GZL_00224 [Streptomyces sp. 769]